MNDPNKELEHSRLAKARKVLEDARQDEQDQQGEQKLRWVAHAGSTDEAGRRRIRQTIRFLRRSR